MDHFTLPLIRVPAVPRRDQRAGTTFSMPQSGLRRKMLISDDFEVAEK
jgi:hypothetical protein